MPLKQYLDRYDPRSIPVPESFRDSFAGKPGLHRREADTWAGATEEDVRVGRAHYYGYVEQLDAQIGRVLDALEATGQSANTLVVFTTDHGDTVGAHRMWIKGWIPYEECYRIPLIVRWPGVIRAGSRSLRLVQLQDLAHTYVQAGGGKELPYPGGRSLIPLFENPGRTDWSDDILCAYYGGEFLYTQRIAVNRRYKYVFNGFDCDEMYDLERDPHEMRNVAGTAEYRAQSDDMRSRLWTLMDRFEDPFGDVRARNSAGQNPDRYGAARYLPRGNANGSAG